MFRTLEATIDETGNVRLLEPLQLSSARRALVTILDETHADAEQVHAGLETALLSEPAREPISSGVRCRSRAMRGRVSSSPQTAA